MQEFNEVYHQNKKNIENFLSQTIQNLGALKNMEHINFKNIFQIFPSLELTYICEKERYTQISANIYQEK